MTTKFEYAVIQLTNDQNFNTEELQRFGQLGYEACLPVNDYKGVLVKRALPAKYEYLFEAAPPSYVEEKIAIWLNQLGAQGWRMCSTSATGRYTFMRETLL